MSSREPRPQRRVVCHDGTPFANLRCPCGWTFHAHRSQALARMADPDAILMQHCPACGHDCFIGPPALLLEMVDMEQVLQDEVPYPLLYWPGGAAI